LAGIFAISWLISLQIAGQAAPPAINGGQGIGIGFVISRIITGILLYGAIVNAMLGGFNLLPAFPLDGGRILRAALVRSNRNYDEATRIATKVGIGISYFLMAFGFVTMLTGSLIGGFWLLLLGWFIQSGAQTYRQQSELAHALSGVRLKDIMNTAFVTVNPDITMNELFTNYFNVYRKSEFPVLDKDGCLLGSIGTKEAMNIPEHSIEDVKVEEIMIRVDDLIVMGQNCYADEALKRMYKENKSRVFVCSNNNDNANTSSAIQVEKLEMLKLIGIISKTDLFKVATEIEEYEKNIER